MNRRLVVPIIPTVALPTIEPVEPAPSPGPGGTVDVCVRAQDGNGVGAGGKLSVNATALPKVETARNTSGCTILVIHQLFPGDVRIERSSLEQGKPFSVCVTSP